MSEAVFWIVGMPLLESHTPNPQAAEVLGRVDFVIGERRKVTSRYLKAAGVESGKEIYYLDPDRKDEREAIEEAMAKAANEGQHVALCSDVGLPLLFDPGVDILTRARKLGFRIRSVPGPTSWGTACALSGWNPPFLVQGFLDRDNDKRNRTLSELKKRKEHIVLMETPYRFLKALLQWSNAFGPNRKAFLAWELGTEEEHLLWANLGEIEGYAKKKGLEKGEFVMIVAGDSR